MKRRRKRKGILYYIGDFIPFILYMLSIGIFIGTMSLLEDEISIPILWKIIIEVIGCICMIVSTIACIAYRHAQGEVYNFKNATKIRIKGYIVFLVLCTTYILFEIISNPVDIGLTIGISILLYLGGYLCFKYIRIIKYERDYRMGAILLLLAFTVMLVLKFIQVWFNFGMQLNY